MSRLSHIHPYRGLAALAVAAGAILPLAIPAPAHAWWRAGWGWRGGVYVAPRFYVAPPVYAPPPAYYAPPPVFYAPPPAYYVAPAYSYYEPWPQGATGVGQHPH